MPMPPPLLHTRSGNEFHERPQTPTSNGHLGFTSPVQTPSGSPSKRQLPPGATDLPNAFDNAMILAPGSPTRGVPGSPGKGLSVGTDNIGKDPFADQNSGYFAQPVSPTRSSNKENAPGSPLRYEKDQSHAAQARQQHYQAESKRAPPTQRLSAEDAAKLQLPKVKRLANVTQLCKFCRHGFVSY